MLDMSFVHKLPLDTSDIRTVAQDKVIHILRVEVTCFLFGYTVRKNVWFFSTMF